RDDRTGVIKIARGRSIPWLNEGKKELLKTPSKPASTLAIGEMGALQKAVPDWRFQRAPGSMVDPAPDARQIWRPLNGWSKLAIVDKSGVIAVTKNCSLPDQWCSERNYAHAWYALEADLGSSFSPKKMWLTFDAVAHFCVVFVNGKEAGSHIGGFTPFSLEITDLIQPGLNTIAILVQDETAVVDKEKERAVSQLGPRPGRLQAYVGGGIRGGIYFEAREEVHVARIRVKPSTRENVLKTETWICKDMEEEVEGAAIKQAVYEWPHGTAPVLQFPERPVHFIRGEREVKIESSISWENPNLWSPEHPHLYILRTTVEAGRRSESWETRFGFREFWIEGKDFMLNGKPVRLLGDGALRRELLSLVPDKARVYNREALKFLKREFNFNAIRLHAEIFPVWATLAADEAGYLVINQSSIICGKKQWYIRGAEDFLNNTEIQFSEWYWRDVNNPSVVIWDMENEVIRDQRTPELEKFALTLDQFIKKHDPEAIVEHSGAAYYHPRQEIIHVHMQEQYSRIMREWEKEGTAPLILGEFWMGGRGETRLPNGYEYTDRQDWHQEEARLYREQMLEMRYYGVSGIMSHRLTHWPTLEPGPLLSQNDCTEGGHKQYRWRFPDVRSEGARGLAPVVGFVWPRKATVIEGKPFRREVVVCNDRDAEVSLTVTCKYGLQTESWEITPGPAEQHRLEVSFTPVNEVSEMVVKVKEKAGRFLEYDRVPINVIPSSLASFSLSNRRLVVVPEIDSATAAALEELNVPYRVSEDIPEVAENTIVLLAPGAADDALGRNAAAVREYLAAGGRLLALKQEQAPRWLPLELPFWSAVRSSIPEFDRGGWDQTNKDLIYSREVQVYAPGHPAFSALKPCDFKEWSPEDGRISDDVFIRPNAVKMRTDGAYRVLLGATRRENASLVELRVGKGTAFLCQAQVLQQRKHPAARTLFFNMLRYLDGPAWAVEQTAIGLMGEISASRIASMTGIEQDLFVDVTDRTDVPFFILAGDKADTEKIVALVKAGKTVFVLSCETCSRLPGYEVDAEEEGKAYYYSATRSGIEDHPLFWGVASASFLPLDETPIKGALSAVPPDARLLLGGHCCGHSPLKNDWSVDIGFYGLETREEAPPVAVEQKIEKGSLIATTIEPWQEQAETQRQLLTNLLANAGVAVPNKSGQISTVRVKHTVPLQFDGKLDDWTNDMEDINLSRYSHAEPLVLTSKEIVEGKIEDELIRGYHQHPDLTLSGIIYLLYEQENLLIGGVIFCREENPEVRIDVGGFTKENKRKQRIRIDPQKQKLEIDDSPAAGSKIVTGYQSASEIIDTRLLNFTQIHRQTGKAEILSDIQGLTFETAILWSSLGFQEVPVQLQARVRLSGDKGVVLQQPAPSGETKNYLNLQMEKKERSEK
ncbi:MAG: glycoside hydrolase family 2 TIM barrel-domain containing protein, partial [Desulfobia sp.]